MDCSLLYVLAGKSMKSTDDVVVDACNIDSVSSEACGKKVLQKSWVF